MVVISMLLVRVIVLLLVLCSAERAAAFPVQGPVRGRVIVPEGEQAEQIVVSVRCYQSGIHGGFAAGDAHAVIDAGESFTVPFVFRGIFPTGCTLRVFHPDYVAAYRRLNDDFTQQVGTIELKSWHAFFDEGPTDPPMHSTYPWPKLEFNQHLSNMLYYYVPAFAEGEQRRRLGRFVVGLHRLTDRAIATGVYGKDGRGESSSIIKDLHRLEDAVEFAASPSRLSALATANNAEAIGKLSANGDYADIWDRNGWSPLLTAAALGNTEAAIALIDGGVEVGRERGVGYGSAMKTALSNRRWQTVAALVGRGAPFDIDPFYNTKIAATLCALAADGDVASLRLMIGRGMSPDLASSSGYTALMCAAEANQLESARFLLESGANPDAQATHNRNAKRMAQSKRNEAMGELLQTYSRPQ